MWFLCGYAKLPGGFLFGTSINAGTHLGSRRGLLQGSGILFPTPWMKKTTIGVDRLRQDNIRSRDSEAVSLMLSRWCANAHWRQAVPYLEELVLADKPAVGLTMQMQGADMIRKSMDNEILYQGEAASLAFRLLPATWLYILARCRQTSSQQASGLSCSIIWQTIGD